MQNATQVACTRPTAAVAAVVGDWSIGLDWWEIVDVLFGEVEELACQGAHAFVLEVKEARY